MGVHYRDDIPDMRWVTPSTTCCGPDYTIGCQQQHEGRQTRITNDLLDDRVRSTTARSEFFIVGIKIAASPFVILEVRPTCR